MAYILPITGDSLYRRISIAEFDVITPMLRTRRSVNAVSLQQEGQEEPVTYNVIDRQVGLRFKGLDPPGWNPSTQKWDTDMKWNLELYWYREKKYKLVQTKAMSTMTVPYEKTNGYTLVLTGWDMLDIFATAFFVPVKEGETQKPLSYTDLVTAAVNDTDLYSIRSKNGVIGWTQWPAPARTLWSTTFTIRIVSEDGLICGQPVRFRVAFNRTKENNDNKATVDKKEVLVDYRFVIKNKQ